MEPISTTLATHALKKPIDEIYATLSEKIGVHYKTWVSKENIRTALKKITGSRNVRTISSRSLVDLLDVYYPAKIIFTNKRQNINSISELELVANTNKIIFSGIAGQGKSFFMRFLWLQEIENSNTIPIFVNLREINHGISLRDLLFQGLDLIGVGLKKDEIALKVMLDSGRLRLFLDGLDEVNREHVISLKSEIINLTTNHKDTSITITSRPGALLDHLYEIPDFSIFEIAKLDGKDYLEFLTKIGTPRENATNLVEALERKENNKVRNVVETPLMLTLLVMVYGCKTIIPNNLPDFYKEMFHVLSHLHDESKPGYVRQWATSLSPAEINKLFEAFCYTSMELASNSLTQDQFADSFTSAKEITNTECTAQGFKTDLVESVCLMAKDGLNTTFIHKSVQEFFCAFFISHCKDDEFSRQFYQSFDNIQRILKFDQTLKFLEQIDRSRYSQHYLQYWWEKFSVHYGTSNAEAILDKFVEEAGSSISLNIENPLQLKLYEIILATSKIEDTKVERVTPGDGHVSFSFMVNRKKAIASTNKYINEIKGIISQEEKSSDKKHHALIGLLKKKPLN